MAEHLVHQGRLDEALGLHRRAQEISERLVSLEPSQADWQMALSFDHASIGDILARRGDAQAALASYRRALEIRQKLASADSSNDYFQEEVGNTHLRIGDTLSVLGEPAAAARAWSRTVEVLAPFASGSEKPDGVIWELYALALIHLGRIDEARPVVEKLRRAGWPRTPVGDELAEICRRHGLAAAD